MQAASLGCIGLGLDPLQPEWGAMLSHSKSFYSAHPHEMLFPGLFIAVFVFAIMGILPNPPAKLAGGEIMLGGESLTEKREEEMLKVRGGKIAMIF